MSALIHFMTCGAEFPRHDQISPGGQKEKRCGDQAATGLFCWGDKIDGSLLKFCQRHGTSLSGTAKCDLAKFKQPAVTFCLLVKIVRPRQ